MRAIHRVLGYLAVGLVMVYSLSGIVLIHRTGNFMKTSSHVESTIAPGLDAAGLSTALKIKGMKVTDETAAVINFKDGTYDKATGHVAYEKREVVEPFNRFIGLHKLSDGQDRHIAVVTTIFGIILFLLALTSLFMYKPAVKQFKANMLYVAAGVIATVVLLLCL